MVRERREGISGVNGQCLKPGYFRETEHKVHILDSLSGGPFNQIINATDNYEPSCPVVNSGVN